MKEVLQLVGRVVVWSIVVVVTFVGGWHACSWLYAQRYPREMVAQSFLRSHLHDMTPQQEVLVQQAICHDPLAAMLAVSNAQGSNKSPWKSLDDLTSGNSDAQSSAMVAVQRLALEASIDGKLGTGAASQFTASTLALWAILHEASPQEAAKFLSDVQLLSTDEYENAANDPAYVLIASQLTPQHRDDFRRHQEILTPLLAAASNEEWDRLMEGFQKAQPRVAEIFNDSQLGPTYGMAYMLNFDQVIEICQEGIKEKQAIEFATANAASIRELAKVTRDWAKEVKRLVDLKPPGDGRSVFEIACSDPAVFWLVAHDPTAGRESSQRILARYAGTELPAILLKYGGNPKLLRAAIDALVRFDAEQDPDNRKSSATASFLNKYQDDELFKELLAEHGAILIPALSAGGSDELGHIRENPADLFKWVDDDGKPKGTPLWTWIPGGNIAFVIREKIDGRSVTWGELSWAAVDGVLLIPMVGEAAWGATTLISGSGKAAGEALAKSSAEEIGKEIIEVAGKEAGAEVLGPATKKGAEVGLKSAIKIGLIAQARSMLKAAGIGAVEVSTDLVRMGASIVAKYPTLSLGTAAIVLYRLYPDQAKQFVRNIADVLREAVAGAAKELGTMMMAAPGKVVEGQWEELQKLQGRHPLLALIYYPLFTAVVLLVISTPLLLLKKLLYPVYAALATLVAKLIALALRPFRGKKKAATIG